MEPGRYKFISTDQMYDVFQDTVTEREGKTKKAIKHWFAQPLDSQGNKEGQRFPITKVVWDWEKKLKYGGIIKV